MPRAPARARGRPRPLGSRRPQGTGDPVIHTCGGRLPSSLSRGRAPWRASFSRRLEVRRGPCAICPIFADAAIRHKTILSPYMRAPEELPAGRSHETKAEATASTLWHGEAIQLVKV